MIGIGKPPTSTMATPTILANHSAPQGCGCNGLPRRLGESLTQWEGCRFVPQKSWCYRKMDPNISELEKEFGGLIQG